MVAFVDAIYGHEGFGYNGGQGHESLAQAAAAESQNDPYAGIERLVYTDATSLGHEVDLTVYEISQDITQRAADPNPAGNWPGGPIWYWGAASSSYILYNINGF